MKRIEIPDLRDLLVKRKDEVKSEINCVSLGTINTFYPSTQTADILINYKRIIKGETDKVIDYPMLINCPVVILNGGGGYISFPITSGDECIILFCDRDIDNWFEYGKKDAPPNSNRVHDLSDGIALIGVFSKQKSLVSYNESGIQISYGGVTFIIDSQGHFSLNTLPIYDSNASAKSGGLSAGMLYRSPIPDNDGSEGVCVVY